MREAKKPKVWQRAEIRTETQTTAHTQIKSCIRWETHSSIFYAKMTNTTHKRRQEKDDRSTNFPPFWRQSKLEISRRSIQVLQTCRNWASETRNLADGQSDDKPTIIIGSYLGFLYGLQHIAHKNNFCTNLLGKVFIHKIFKNSRLDLHCRQSPWDHTIFLESLYCCLHLLIDSPDPQVAFWDSQFRVSDRGQTLLHPSAF